MREFVSGSGRRRSRRGLARLAAVCACGALLAGCAVTPDFPDQNAGPWRPRPDPGQQIGPQPRIPGDQGGPAPAPENQPPPGPPQGCDDPDPAVVATCLNPISAIAVLPSGQAALVAERATGRILRVEPETEPVEIARIPVDAAAGGLSGLALSPTYDEDELIYAYIATPTEHQLVRIAPGDVPKKVLGGIPPGPGGTLAVDGSGALLVATGSGGEGPLAGKLLRVTPFGDPAPDNPDPGSPVVADGLNEPRGLCPDRVTGAIWLTDSEPTADVLRRVVPGQPQGEPAWTWPGNPGASGCVAAPDQLMVTFNSERPAFSVSLGPAGSFVGQPTDVPLERYGRIGAAADGPDGLLVWLGTANKAGGQPISSDDRVFVLSPAAGGGGRD